MCEYISVNQLYKLVFGQLFLPVLGQHELTVPKLGGQEDRGSVI